MDPVDGWNVQCPREDLVVVLSKSLAVQNGRLGITTGIWLLLPTAFREMRGVNDFALVCHSVHRGGVPRQWNHTGAPNRGGSPYSWAPHSDPSVPPVQGAVYNDPIPPHYPSRKVMPRSVRLFWARRRTVLFTDRSISEMNVLWQMW